MRRKYTAFLVFFTALLTAGCGKTEQPGDNFDKKGMFTNYADNLILPAYNQYGASLSAVETALTDFSTSPDVTKLTTLKSALLLAYTKWEACEIYEQTTPADNELAIYNTNFYPTDTNAVWADINGGNTSPDFVKTVAPTQKGLPAIEYLLFSRNLSDAQILERFTSAANATATKTYLASLITDLKRIQQSIVSQWTSYRATFISNIGTDAASTFSVLVNTIALRADNLKRHQVGIPAGYVGNTPTTSLAPGKTEAYYSNNSIPFMLLTLNNLKDVLNGKNVTDGLGLYDYLKELNATSTIGGDLADDIMAQIDLCITKANACAPDYSAVINSDKAKADALFLETKKLLVLLKVDVPSAIGVTISYSDNDGD